MSRPVNAVIYARYSSHSQTEQSIEGQLHDSYSFAEKNGYNVIGEYIDRALTGKSDDRPDFQRMIRDAEKRQFQIVIVWKLDRFARNRFDSAMYKRILKKYGARVVSVMENITDSPEGIILEGMLEALAEYYSANLSENIKRGQAESIKKGWFVGGSVPFGYVVQDHHLVPDERTAPAVRELYQRYADGESLAAIAEDFNARGIHTAKGAAFTINSFSKLLPNPAYIGQWTYKGQIVPGCSAPIVDQDVYDRVVSRRARNRRAPSASRSAVSYLLSGKSFCGCCGMPLTGDMGTSKTGERYFYYSCSGRKRRLNNCRKHTEKQEFLEWYVCEQTVQYILAPDMLSRIASAVVRIYNADVEDSRLVELERTVDRLNCELNLLVDRLATVPDKAVARIVERMDQLESQRIDAETDLAKLRMQQKIRITEKEVSAWLKTFSRGDLFDPAFRRLLIDTFINSVYLWDDRIVIFYNISGGAKEVIALDPLDLEQIEKDGQLPSSELSVFGGAWNDNPEHAAPRFVFVRGLVGLVLFR